MKFNLPIVCFVAYVFCNIFKKFYLLQNNEDFFNISSWIL